MPRMDHHCFVLSKLQMFYKSNPQCLDKCIHYKNQKAFMLLFFWICFSLATAIFSIEAYLDRSNSQVSLVTQTFPFSLIPMASWFPITWILRYFVEAYNNFYLHYLGVSRLWIYFIRSFRLVTTSTIRLLSVW
jgi:hypothetical protein